MYTDEELQKQIHQLRLEVQNMATDKKILDEINEKLDTVLLYCSALDKTAKLTMMDTLVCIKERHHVLNNFALQCHKLLDDRDSREQVKNNVE